ncbi:MAG TPA: tRNA 2-selenouridine(34) synthase MnmH [Flavisolibacter sp.]|nr:tRNA 2-selenouridine(34) synthase MnmH [Flavisolibacter sp.]
MAIERLAIKEFLAKSRGKVLLDVRSPGEYNHAHIPSATSFPLFTDEERKIVGTTYKQKSREDAIKIGLDFFGPKMRKMVEEAEEIVGNWQSAIGNKDDPNCKLPTANSVFLYCWRGGMRSAGVAWLLDLYGFKVYTLAGGYKAFRNYVLQTFEQPFQFKVLGGYTGSGKTEVLNELEKNGEIVIDLEKIASHKGSAFGAFKMPPQPKQEMFENLLAFELLEKSMVNGQWSMEDSDRLRNDSPFTIHHSPIWLEDEAQRIGDLNLPNALWDNMRVSPIFFLEIPFEERLNHIVAEYGECEKEKLIDSTKRISQRLGGLDTKNTIEFLEKGEIKEAFSILLRYYDKRYLNGLHNRENISSLLTKIQCDTVTPKNAALLTKPQLV